MALLIFWWMIPLWLLTIAIYVGARYWLLVRRKRKLIPTVTPVAHSSNLTTLPQYVVALKRYRVMTRWTAAILGLSLLATIIVTARPAALTVISPVQKNRDIMLCLDASGSLLREDTTIINRFSTLVSGFSGQRFGLTLFNSSAVTVIPLNNNYELTSQQLKLVGEAFKQQSGDMFTALTNATLVDFSSGTSLVSDGLASCIQHMDSAAQHRSQTIILATDNEINGTPVVASPQAIALATQRNIHVYAIDPGVSDTDHAGDHEQLKSIADQTGGKYYLLSDKDTVYDIIDSISEQRPESYVGLPQPAVNDSPRLFLYTIALLSAASVALLWRLER